MRRSLKLKPGTPIWVEQRLTIGKGYHVAKRIPGEYTLLAKLDNPNTTNVQHHSVINNVSKPDNGMAVLREPLSLQEEQALEIRCDRIVHYFPDPYAMNNAVRTRLHNMMQTLPSVQERQFVLDYMDENFPLEDKGK